MGITLQPIGLAEAEAWLALQKTAYAPTFARYQDTETTPTRDTLEDVRRRMARPECRFFYITAERGVVGGIHVHSLENQPLAMRLANLFILPEHRDRGIGRAAITLVEACFPNAESWELDTIAQEARNCHLYESMGYVRSGGVRPINARMDLVYYRKPG